MEKVLKPLKAGKQRRSQNLLFAFIHRLGSLFDLIEYHLFDNMPAWNEALACPLEQRIADLGDPKVRRKLQADMNHHTARVWSGRWDLMKVHQSAQKRYENSYVSEIAQAEAKRPLMHSAISRSPQDLKGILYVEMELGGRCGRQCGDGAAPLCASWLLRWRRTWTVHLDGRKM